MKKFNKKIILITSFSTLITIFFVCALFFFIGKTYSSAPVTTELNGTSIYITGEGVTWDGSKYEVEPGSDIQIQIVNETRLFKSVSNTFKEKIYNDPSKKIPDVDKRQRQEIEDKKNAVLQQY